MASAGPYSHVELAEEVEQGISDTDAISHPEQDSASGQCLRHAGRRLVIIPFAVVGILALVALLRLGGQSSDDTQNPLVRPGSLLAKWSFIPRMVVPTLPPASAIEAAALSTVQRSMSCETDVVVQTTFGSTRVRSAQYSGGQRVPVLDKFTKLAAVPCTVTYSVTCSGGLAGLHVENSCQEPQQTAPENFDGFQHLVGRMSGSAKNVTVGEGESISFRSGELPQISSGSVQVIATFETCEAVSTDACRQGCCSPGFQCIFENKLPQAWRKHKLQELASTGLHRFLGVCVPTRWTPAQVCMDPSLPDCQSLVANITATAASWQLVITSGGGGGHMAAAHNLGTHVKKRWALMVQAASIRLNMGVPLLTKFGQTALTRTMEAATNQSPPLEIVDIMHSPCTNLLGQLGVPMGDLLTGAWDEAQTVGDIPKLKYLFEHQGVADDLFYRQCLAYMRNVLKGDLGLHGKRRRVGAPSHLLATEPMLLPSISEAVEELTKEGSKLAAIDLYMTDLPCEVNGLPYNFWGPIKRMQELHPNRSHRLILHTVAPISGGAAAIAKSCNLDISQVVIERFLPVNPGFYEAGGVMPRPHTATQIFLKAQLPEEKAFLGGAARTFDIGATDVVVLVMLGSQPTVKAIHTYLDQAGRLQQPPVGSVHWIFLACGPHQKSSYRDLYRSIAAKATAMNKEQEQSGLRLRFIPFTGQPAQSIEARAEVCVTRSGGMTAGELLALDARGDNKQVFLHIEVVDGVPPKPPCCDERAEQAWEEKALKNGMVTWEAGNAKYLINKVGAQLVTPETFAGVVKYPRSAAAQTT